MVARHGGKDDGGTLLCAGSLSVVLSSLRVLDCFPGMLFIGMRQSDFLSHNPFISVSLFPF